MKKYVADEHPLSFDRAKHCRASLDLDGSETRPYTVRAEVWRPRSDANLSAHQPSHLPRPALLNFSIKMAE